MWENERSRTLSIIKTVVIVLLILLLIGGLIFAILYVRAANEERDKELSEIVTQQKQEQSAARQDALDAIQREYEKDLQTVAEYVPGIVCWGDKTTAAVSGTLNYPYVLQTYINTYLCDIYDFSSTIENASDFVRLKWDEYKVKIPVVNMASGNESTYTVLGRAGTIPYIVGEDIVVPADCIPVSIVLKTAGKDYTYVTPLTGGDIGVNPVVINGIEGTLSINSESYNYNGTLNYFFTRTTPGAETPISAGTTIKTSGADLYKDYIHVVLIGIYGDYQGADDLVQQVKSLLSRQIKNPERFIVLGPYLNSTYPTSTYELDAIDTAMLQAFGSRYISIRKYLSGDGYADAGIAPTSEDKYYINQNAVPPSFKVSSHSEELNSRAHKLVGKLIYTRMQSLGYFDEIIDELNLNETTKRILKDDPAFFDTIIKNVLN
jgi:hypothetical protein